jgi:hypothetical protein
MLEGLRAETWAEIERLVLEYLSRWREAGSKVLEGD